MSSLPVSTPEPRTQVRRRPLRPAPTGPPISDAPAPAEGDLATHRRTPLRAASAPEPEIPVVREPAPRRTRRKEPLRALDPVPERPALSLVGPPDEGEEGAAPVAAADAVVTFLDDLAPDRLHVLHHRRIAGPDAALNHLVVAEHGVWVIAMVEVGGVVDLAVERRALTGDELLIGGDSGAPLLQALDLQVARVMDALDHIGVDEVPVRGAICLVDTELAKGQRPIQASGHEVTWPTALAPLLLAPGPFDDDDRQAAHRFLDRTFPPAS